MKHFVHRLVHAAGTGVLVLAAGIGTPAHALDIAQQPLFLGSDVKPNFIFAIDDSLSMLSDRIFPGGDPENVAWNNETKSFFATAQPGVLFTAGPGDAYWNVFTAKPVAGAALPPDDTSAFARSPRFNAQYFDPASTYVPWTKADGSHWPEADPHATFSDPRPGGQFAPGNAAPIDLTDPAGWSPTENHDDTYRYVPGMTIPAGTIYFADGPTDSETCKGLPATDSEWVELKTPVQMDGYCYIYVRSFLPTFTLAAPSELPPGYGYASAPIEVPHALGPGSPSLWRYEIRPGNFASGTQYDAAIGNFANWFQYHRTRFLAMVASATAAMADVDGVRIGTFKINDRVPVDMLDVDIPMQRKALFETLTSLQATAIVKNDYLLGGTPNRDAVAYIGTQFARTDVDAPITAACQVNAGMLFTDGATRIGNGPATVGNADGALPPPLNDAFADTMPDIVTSLFEGSEVPLRKDFPKGLVPVPAACPSNDPRLDCVTNLHMKFHGIVYGPSGKIFGVEPGPTANPFVNIPDWSKGGDPRQIGGPTAIDEIWHASLNGRGSFIRAEHPADVTAAIKSAVSGLGASASTTGGIGATSSRRDGDFLSIVPSYRTEDWTGDLTAYTVDTNGAYTVPAWSAAEKLEALDPADRKVFVSTDGGMKAFTVANLGGEAEAVKRLGLPSAMPYGRSVDDAIGYLLGDHTFEKKNPDGVYRDRAARIGDIFGSQPDVLTRAGYGYTGLPTDQGGGATGPGSYGEFMETTKKNRTPVAFVGANDGMLHAFNATAGNDGGRELFAVVPAAVLEQMGKLPDPAYKHHYFVDGSPVQGDAWDGTWKTLLLVPTGAGGNSIMALDVTDPATSFDEKNFLWEFTDPGLNLTLGKPHIVLLEDGTWAAVFGSGIDSVPQGQTEAFVYVVDLFTGALIAKVAAQIPYGDGDEYGEDGIVNVVPVDTDFDLKVDTIYAGDYDGYLWRVDVAQDGGIALGNGGVPLFRALDRNGRAQRFTGGIDAFPHHIRGEMVFLGTGRYLESASDRLPQPMEQSFYGIWDDPLHPGTVKRADLRVQEILGSEVVGGVDARRISDAPVDWSNQRGWVLDLVVKNAEPDGEMFIGQPVVVLGKVIFPTFTPSADSCRASGRSRLYSLSATSGVGELDLAGGTGRYGAAALSAASTGGGPLLAPVLVTSPPAPACVPGSPDCPLPEPDDNGNVLAAPAAGCKTPLGLLLGDSLLNFDSLTCGRQSWQELQ